MDAEQLVSAFARLNNRGVAYTAQNHGGEFTPAQARRMRKKVLRLHKKAGDAGLL